MLCAGTHGGRYLLGGRRADDAAARGVVSVCCGGAARRYVHTYIQYRTVRTISALVCVRRFVACLCILVAVFNLTARDTDTYTVDGVAISR